MAAAGLAAGQIPALNDKWTAAKADRQTGRQIDRLSIVGWEIEIVEIAQTDEIWIWKWCCNWLTERVGEKQAK